MNRWQMPLLLCCEQIGLILVLLQCLRLLTHTFNSEYNQVVNSISDCKVSDDRKEL